MNREKFPLPLVGDFRELEYGRPDGPSLRNAVQDHEAPHERDLVRYLSSGLCVFATPSAIPDVLSPNGAVIAGLHLLTDRRWLWFSDLAHYVERHHVELDSRFIAHVQSRDWSIPELSDGDVEAIVSALFQGGSG